MNAPTEFGAARYSLYVTDDYYKELIRDFSGWQTDDRAVEDSGERDRFRRLIEREARLLDQLLYEQWLECFTDDCIYWVPSTPGGGDPRTEIAVMFDDRRRMEDRVYRLRTGYAWSQAPASRTSRIVSNVEVFSSGRPDERMVRCSFSISEFWDGQIRVLAGWSGYRFRLVAGGWRISAKQVNLINCDQCLRNPSIVL